MVSGWLHFLVLLSTSSCVFSGSHEPGVQSGGRRQRPLRLSCSDGGAGGVVDVRSKPRVSRDVQDKPGKVVFIEGTVRSTTDTPRTNNKSSPLKHLQSNLP